MDASSESQDWVAELVTLLESMKTGQGQPWSGLIARIYADFLIFLGEPLAKRTLERVIKTQFWRPSPAELRAIAYELAFTVPFPNEAWAMMPRSEDDSVVWTAEMAESFGVVREMLAEGETVRAGIAFVEHYSRALETARLEWRAPVWTLTLGTDKEQRIAVVQEAIAKGRLSPAWLETHFPDLAPPRLDDRRLLPGRLSPMPPDLRDRLKQIGKPLPPEAAITPETSPL